MKMIFNSLVLTSKDEDSLTMIGLVAGAAWAGRYGWAVGRFDWDEVVGVGLVGNEDKGGDLRLVFGVREGVEDFYCFVEEDRPEQKEVFFGLEEVELAEVLVVCELILILLEADLF